MNEEPRVEEIVRRKEAFGEDPYIFTRVLSLSKKELELCKSFGPLEKRKLGQYMGETGLIPGRVICYVTEGYRGNYTGWNFPDNKRARGWELKVFNVGSFPKEARQRGRIQELADLVVHDLTKVVDKRGLIKISNRTAVACNPECSTSNYIHPLTSGFCGVSFRIDDLETDEEKGKRVLYTIILAYAANLRRGASDLKI